MTDKESIRKVRLIQVCKAAGLTFADAADLHPELAGHESAWRVINRRPVGDLVGLLSEARDISGTLPPCDNRHMAIICAVEQALALAQSLAKGRA